MKLRKMSAVIWFIIVRNNIFRVKRVGKLAGTKIYILRSPECFEYSTV